MTIKVTAEVFNKKCELSLFGQAGLVKKIQVRGGSNLWVALRKAGMPIGSACSGVGVCAACHVTVTPTEGVTDQTEFEVSSLARNGKGTEMRLACLCRVISDLTVKAEYW